MVEMNPFPLSWGGGEGENLGLKLRKISTF